MWSLLFMRYLPSQTSKQFPMGFALKLVNIFWMWMCVINNNSSIIIYILYKIKRRHVTELILTNNQIIESCKHFFFEETSLCTATFIFLHIFSFLITNLGFIEFTLLLHRNKCTCSNRIAFNYQFSYIGNIESKSKGFHWLIAQKMLLIDVHLEKISSDAESVNQMEVIFGVTHFLMSRNLKSNHRHKKKPI